MADLKKLTKHPEQQEIITKLVHGETPKNVSNWLKGKYSKPDESHLRLSSTILQEFVDKYAPKYGALKKIAEAQHESKLDKEIAASLLNNKAWNERIAEMNDEEMDLPRMIRSLITIMEARAEQIFDKIQENPGDTKKDYVFTKYLELISNSIEKADKIVNGRPDVHIEHTYTVQMMDQQAAAIQEAVRKTLQHMSPELVNVFLENLNSELNRIKPRDVLPPTLNIEKEKQSVEKLTSKYNEIEGKLLEGEVVNAS